MSSKAGRQWSDSEKLRDLIRSPTERWGTDNDYIMLTHSKGVHDHDDLQNSFVADRVCTAVSQDRDNSMERDVPTPLLAASRDLISQASVSRIAKTLAAA
jgi:hypothetical protein